MTLIIRKEQMEVLRSERGSELEAPLLHRLTEEYPEESSRLGDDGARAFVRETIRSAKSRGVFTDAALVGLLRLYVELGPRLQRAPFRDWANQVLDHPTLPGDLKVNLVTQRLTALTQGRRIVSHRDEAFTPGEETPGPPPQA